jgi:hypothetical protein
LIREKAVGSAAAAKLADTSIKRAPIDILRIVFMDQDRPEPRAKQMEFRPFQHFRETRLIQRIKGEPQNVKCTAATPGQKTFVDRHGLCHFNPVQAQSFLPAIRQDGRRFMACRQSQGKPHARRAPARAMPGLMKREDCSKWIA